jgi:hypothetical protein
MHSSQQALMSRVLSLLILAFFATASHAAGSPITVTHVSPSDGGYTFSTQPKLAFNFSADTPSVNLDSLEAFVDGTIVPWSTDNQGNYFAVMANVVDPLTEGSHWATVVFVDADGNIGGLRWTFTVDLSNPVVSIETPADMSSAVGPDVQTIVYFS